MPDYKFDLMYSKRAFVHWYVGEGMEEVRRLSFAPLSKASPCRRVNFQRLGRILLHWKRITKRWAPTRQMLKKAPSIKQFASCRSFTSIYYLMILDKILTYQYFSYGDYGLPRVISSIPSIDGPILQCHLEGIHAILSQGDRNLHAKAIVNEDH